MINKHRPLYIGIHGFAGSGKDTVTKMIRTILSRDWVNIEECKAYYKSVYIDPTISATYDIDDTMHTSNVFCIAFADQLKTICSSIFGVPTSRFYMNKNTAWICMNKDFKYTEIEPSGNNCEIVTAEEYYNSYFEFTNNTDISYYMSLRELLVYVGTYVLQHNINQNIFVNVVNNIINSEIRSNKELNYVICTDVRFAHEYDYIKKMNGIVINVTRESVTQLDNVAEHDLDDFTNYDFVIDNSGTYDDLFEQVWDMIHDNIVFSNIIVELDVHENVNNYVRKMSDNAWQLCVEYGMQNIQYDDGRIYMLSPIGGPIIKINSELDCYEKIYINDIEFDLQTDNFMLLS